MDDAKARHNSLCMDVRCRDHLAQRLARSDGGGPVGADGGVRSAKGNRDPDGRNVGNADPAGQETGSGYGSDNGYGSDSGYGSDGAERGGTGKQAGKVLTDSEGFTLYRFDKDTASPPKSNCEGEYAKIWAVVPGGMSRRRPVPIPHGSARPPAPTAPGNSPLRAGRCTTMPRTPRPATPMGRAWAAPGSRPHRTAGGPR
ncbi:hypothetical protein ACFU9X_11320 [Streptomyces atratus]|uniref:hypothetical protein n=1 Tax=Streptomyces atratus TaxID=1893 RepID=UPI003682A0BF